jgi:hypothetical protein
MLGEVHYGGRVTDDFDKRLLNTFCKVWFHDDMFHDDFVFYEGYKIVKFKNVSEYVSHIDTFATNDPPQVYGLHPNADITYINIKSFTYLFLVCIAFQLSNKHNQRHVLCNGIHSAKRSRNRWRGN